MRAANARSAERFNCMDGARVMCAWGAMPSAVSRPGSAADLRRRLGTSERTQKSLSRGVGAMLLLVAAWTVWQGWQRGL